MELEGRVAAVTGAASGIGRALALALAGAGMDVALADVDEPGLGSVAAELRGLGRRALEVVTDVREKAQVEALLERCLTELGGCHLVANNAGVAHPGAMLETTDEQWQRTIDIDLWGVIHGCRVFGKHFADQGEGHVVNTASTAGLVGVPGLAAYSTAKFGVVGLSEAMRWELAQRGVGVTVVCPGVVRTNIVRNAGIPEDHETQRTIRRAPSPQGLAKRVLDAVRRDLPLVRYGLDSYLLTETRWLPTNTRDRLGRWAGQRALRSVAALRAPEGEA